MDFKIIYHLLYFIAKAISLSIVLYCYNRMYRTLADSILLGSLTHGAVILDNVGGNLHRPFLDITLQKIPLKNLFYNV